MASVPDSYHEDSSGVEVTLPEDGSAARPVHAWSPGPTGCPHPFPVSFDLAAALGFEFHLPAELEAAVSCKVGGWNHAGCPHHDEARHLPVNAARDVQAYYPPDLKSQHLPHPPQDQVKFLAQKAPGRSLRAD